MTTEFHLVKANGELWKRLLYKAFAESVAERDSRLSDVGPLQVVEASQDCDLAAMYPHQFAGR